MFQPIINEPPKPASIPEMVTAGIVSIGIFYFVIQDAIKAAIDKGAFINASAPPPFFNWQIVTIMGIIVGLSILITVLTPVEVQH